MNFTAMTYVNKILVDADISRIPHPPVTTGDLWSVPDSAR